MSVYSLQIQNEIDRLLKDAQFTPRTGLKVKGQVTSVRIAAKMKRNARRCDLEVKVMPFAIKASLQPEIEKGAREAFEAATGGAGFGEAVHAEAARLLQLLDSSRWQAGDLGGLVLVLRQHGDTLPIRSMEAITNQEGSAWFRDVSIDGEFAVQRLLKRVFPLFRTAGAAGAANASTRHPNLLSCDLGVHGEGLACFVRIGDEAIHMRFSTRCDQLAKGGVRVRAIERETATIALERELAFRAPDSSGMMLTGLRLTPDLDLRRDYDISFEPMAEFS